MLKNLLAREPAVLSWAVNGGVALLAAQAGASRTQEAWIVTVVSAVAAVSTAVRARPVNLPVILGGLTTLTTAAAAFGLHPSAHVIAVGTALASTVLPILLRGQLTPVTPPPPPPAHP
jgi:hypothetical protein